MMVRRCGSIADTIGQGGAQHRSRTATTVLRCSSRAWRSLPTRPVGRTAMRRLSTLVGLCLGLIGSLGYLLWEIRPRRVNYAFVVDSSSYIRSLGITYTTAFVVFGLPVLGAVLGLVVGVLFTRKRR